MTARLLKTCCVKLRLVIRSLIPRDRSLDNNNVMALRINEFLLFTR